VNRIFVVGAGAFADSRTMERAQSAGLLPARRRPM
jgi:hypothetical protein